MISGGRTPWNAIAICEMSQTSWQTGKLRMNLGNLSKDQWFHLVHWWNTSQIPRETKLEFINLAWKYLPGIFPGYALIAGRIWKGDILTADIEELERLDASEIYPRRLNAKEVVITHKRRRICISCGRWFINIFRLRIPRIHSETGTHREKRDSQRRISRRWGRVSTWRNRRWCGNSGRLLVKSRRLCLPSSSWTESSIFRDVAQEKRLDDHWNVDGNRNVSDSWTGFTRFT